MKAKEEASDQAQPLISDTTDSVIKGSDQSPADEVERVAKAISIAAYDAMRAQGFSGGWDHDEFSQAIAAAALSAIRNTPQAIEAREVERQARLIFDAMPMRSKTRLYLSDLEEALATALSTQGEGHD